MMVRAGEIYLVAGVEIGICTDARPCLVLQVHDKTGLICLLSAQFDLAEGHEISILKTDPDFPASGLKKDSFVPDAPERDIAISILQNQPCSEKPWVILNCASRDGLGPIYKFMIVRTQNDFDLSFPPLFRRHLILYQYMNQAANLLGARLGRANFNSR